MISHTTYKVDMCRCDDENQSRFDEFDLLLQLQSVLILVTQLVNSPQNIGHCLILLHSNCA